MGYDPFKVWSPEAKRLSQLALWYAWGRIDAGTADLAGASLDMGTAFSEWYGDLAEKHASGSVWRPAMLNEWERFSTAGRIPASVFTHTEHSAVIPSEQSWKDHTECRGFDSQEFFWHCHSHEVYGQKY